MKTELKAKFLQHLTNKRKDEGFTLIELLVVIIIIGILSAIALPSFLSQASKARQSEAKNNIGAVNRAQQAHYLENQTFTATIGDLGIGVANTDNYGYTAAAVTNLETGVANLAKSDKADLKEYAGGVFKNATAGTTETILCEGNTATVVAVAPTNATTCGDSMSKLK